MFIILNDEVESFLKSKLNSMSCTASHTYREPVPFFKMLYHRWIRLFVNQSINETEKEQLFKKIMLLQGEIFRHQEGRCTQRIQLGNTVYFIKQHTGIGWKEIFKNVLQFRLPVISAKNEWRALHILKKMNVDVPLIVGYGCRGKNPAMTQSFLMTKELPSHVSLEDFCRPWRKDPPSFILKQKIIEKVAEIARTLHENGINHRDFYICHFLLDKKILNTLTLTAHENNNTVKLYLIDLHRAQIRSRVPSRWRIKDLAGLYFSSKEMGLTKKDILRFIRKYRNTPLRNTFNKDLFFWQKVKKRGEKLYKRQEKRDA